jgi:hypothetical protein
MPVPRLQKLIMAMDDEFLILKYLYIASLTRHNIGLMLPEMFWAPHPGHLISGESIFPLVPPLLMTSVGLVTLLLAFIPSIGYFHLACDLIMQLLIMPQLEVLRIGFHFPVAQDIEVWWSIIPIATCITLPNLRWLSLSSLSMSLEVFLSWLISPCLEKLLTFFFNQLIFSDSILLQFLNTTEHLRFGSTRLMFYKKAIEVRLYPDKEVRMYALQMQICCNSLDWQVRCVRQLMNELGTVFSMVEYLTLCYISLGCYQEAGHTHWRSLLQAFNNMRTLSVPKGFIRELSSSLWPDYEELPIEPVLLPELKMLSYSAISDANSVFAAFIDGCQIGIGKGTGYPAPGQVGYTWVRVRVTFFLPQHYPYPKQGYRWVLQ